MTKRPVRHPAIEVSAALVVALSLVACGTSDAGDVAPATAVWTVEGPDLRIGSVDDPDYAFGRVGALAEAPDGMLYSMHPQEVEIRRWNPDGTPAGTVGREGEGPGEFVRPRSIGFFGDSLWVMDSRAYRVSYFDLEGGFLGSVSPTVDIGSRETFPNDPARPDRPLRDGTFHGSAPGWSQEISTGELTRSAHAHLAADGSTIRHFWDLRWERHDILALPNEDGTGGSYMTQPFGDGILTASSDRGLVVVDRRAWEGEGEPSVLMTMLSFAGDTLWERALPYVAKQLPAQRIDSATAATAERFFDFLSRSRPGITLGSLEARIAEATFTPSYLPHVRSVQISQEGDIWLEEFEPDAEGVGWLIFGGDGEPRGRIDLPTSFELRAISGSSLWGIERDELDVEYIVRYRARPTLIA